MKHYIKDNIYHIVDDDTELMSVELTKEPGKQVVIKTSKEVFAGPIELVSFTSDKK